MAGRRAKLRDEIALCLGRPNNTFGVGRRTVPTPTSRGTINKSTPICQRIQSASAKFAIATRIAAPIRHRSTPAAPTVDGIRAALGTGWRRNRR